MATAKRRHAARGAPNGARKTCYVCMPCGVKQPRNPSVTHQVDCDAIYRDTVAPAVTRAGYTCYRGDEPELGGIIQRSMIRLVADSDVMIADLTCWSPNGSFNWVCCAHSRAVGCAFSRVGRAA